MHFLKIFLIPCLLVIAGIFLFRDVEVKAIRAGVVHETEAPDTNTHRYQLQAPEHSLVCLDVVQKGIDLEVRCLSPDGREIWQIDGGLGDRGSERAVFFSRTNLPHLLEIDNPNPGRKGSYSISYQLIDSSSEAARNQLEAMKIMLKADRAFSEKRLTPEVADLYREAARAWQAAGDKEQHLSMLFKAAWLAYQQSRFRLSNTIYQEALAALEPKDELRSRVFHNMGTNYMLLQQWDIAESMLDRALSLRTGATEIRAATLIEKARIQSFAGGFELALETLDEALVILEQLPQSIWRARGLQLYGWTLNLNGKHEQAIEIYQEALKISVEPPDLATLLNGLGEIYRRIGRLEDALQAYRDAARAIAEYNDRDLAAIYANMSQTLYQMNDLERSSELLDVAIDMFTRDENRPALAFNLYYRAGILRDRGMVADAIHDLERCLKITAGLTSNMPDRETRMLFEKTRYRYFERYLDLVLQQSKDPMDSYRAFLAAEQRRACILEEQIRQDASQPVHPDLLKQALVFQTDVATGNSSPAIQQSREFFSDSLQPSRDNLDNPEQIFQAVGDDEILLYYAMGEEFCWYWMISGDGMTFHKSGERRLLEELARKFNRSLATSGSTRSRERISLLGERLGSLLLPEELSSFRGKRVLTAPDGDLLLIPFELLTLADGKMLMDRAETATVFSLNALIALRERNRSREEPSGVVIFAPGHFGDDYAALPYTEEEARTIADMAGSQASLFLGSAANRPNLLESGSQSGQILHLATHGLSGNSSRESALILAGTEKTPTDTITASQIAGMSFFYRLVVLSACHSGVGEYIRGEGMMGLPHSFLQAGAGSVLASLWQQNDRAAGAFMELFYRGLLEHDLSPAQALRNTRLQLRNQQRPPFEWAGFVLLGELQTSDHH